FEDFRQSACHNDDRGLAPIPYNGLDDYVQGRGPSNVTADVAVKDDSQKNTYGDQEATKQNDRHKGVSENLGQSTAGGMIQLQQLVSQRQMVIQLATQCMAKFNQGTESIIGNVK